MASSTIFWVFGMIQPGIEPQSPGPLANTLLIRPMARHKKKIYIYELLKKTFFLTSEIIMIQIMNHDSTWKYTFAFR